MYFYFVSLCNRLQSALVAAKWWMGMSWDTCSDVSVLGMLRTPLYQHATYDPVTRVRFLTLSHSRRILGDAGRGQRRSPGVLEARFECTTCRHQGGAGEEAEVHDVTEHMNAHISSFLPGAADAPRALDYMLSAMRGRGGGGGKALKRSLWDAPVIRCWSRSQIGRTPPGEMVLRVTTMDLEELTFRADDVICL